MMKYEEKVIPLSLYDEHARRLEHEAETVASSSWSTCGREIEDDMLDELRVILRRSADEVRAALERKLTELPEDVDAELLAAYGLR